MAVIDVDFVPTRTFSPFEGLSEAQRLWTAVPRGLLRFHTTQALNAKPVNDSIDISFTCSLPPGFAYVLSSLSLMIAVDTATDWDAFCQLRLFNGQPSIPAGGFQHAAFEMANVPSTVAADPQRILTYRSGTLGDWFSSVVSKPAGAVGQTVVLDYHNSAAAVQAVGTEEFNLSVYQYELNQAARYPLNFPLPVGQR